MRFAKIVFLLSGLYGVLVLVPQYFAEKLIARAYPPPITHPEHFYGFIGLGLAWQILFFIIAADPARLRPAMIPSMLEKISFGVAALVLFRQGRAMGSLLAAGILDLFLAAMFFFA